jgi:hypothetical protein
LCLTLYYACFSINFVKATHMRARARIEELGLRYDKVAGRVGLTPDRFAHVLDGRRPVPEPAEGFYSRLADALFCAPDDVREAPRESGSTLTELAPADFAA